MRSKIFMPLLLFVFALSAAVLNAQPVTEVQEAPKESVKVSGVMYLQWLKEIERPDEAENRNGFDIQRVYLNFAYKIDNIWSTRATLDVGNDNGDKDQRYQAYIKYAYLQAAPDLGFGRLTIQLGMIGTSVIGHIDKQSDYRWLNQNFIDSANLVLHNQKDANVGELSSRVSYGTSGQSIDTSADLGVAASLKVADIVIIDLQVTNGEGYKKTNDITTNDDGKSYLAMVTLTPVQGLYVSGYYRNLITNDAEDSDNFINYYGATVIYVFQGIRAGASYVMSEVSTMAVGGTQATVAKYTLLDVFIMANLKSFTGVPILLAGRYVMGTTKYDEGYTAADGFEAQATVWAAGVGYQFNDKVRLMAYFEEQKSSSDDIVIADWQASARNVWIKAEASF